jgi:peptidoglycan/LPS O-acetylase OafA/YrhL
MRASYGNCLAFSSLKESTCLLRGGAENVITYCTNSSALLNMSCRYLQFLADAGRLYITNATLSVDTFFVLSGLFVAYIFLKQMKHKSSGFNIPMYYLHRYIR